MTTQHTPGPWEIAEDDDHGQAVVRGEHIEIATCWHHCVGSIETEMRANARLIAAAPDMLEFLERCADQSCELGPHHEACGRLDDEDCFGCRARAIIAKAKGE